MPQKRLKIVLISGEASGDLAAARMMTEIQQTYPNAEFVGIGGEKCIHAGLTSICSLKKISVMGFLEVFAAIKHLYSALALCKKTIRQYQPDYVILVDYPGFNLKIAQFAYKLNYPVLYYISPKIWAWKKSRLQKIKRYVKHIAVIFPFEVALYQQAQVPVTLVRNPSLLNCEHIAPRSQTIAKYRLNSNQPIICLMPGSRKKEIQYNFPTIIQSISTLLTLNCQYQFIIPVANTISVDMIRQYIPQHLQHKIVLAIGDQYNVINCCDIAIVVSGTSTLEVALLEKPLCVMYKTSNITYQIAKLFVKVQYISLCNILARKEIAPEFIQHKASIQNITHWVHSTINNIQHINHLTRELAKMRTNLDKQCGNTTVGTCFLRIIQNDQQQLEEKPI